MDIIVLLLLVALGWMYRVHTRWYLLSAATLLGAVPLLIFWTDKQIEINAADYLSRAVYYLLIVALITFAIPKRKKSESILFTTAHSLFIRNFHYIILGYTILIILNYYLPTIPTIALMVVIGGLIFNLKKVIYIYVIVVMLFGVLFMRTVVHEISYADNAGLWAFYSLVVWAIYLIRDNYLQRHQL